MEKYHEMLVKDYWVIQNDSNALLFKSHLKEKGVISTPLVADAIAKIMIFKQVPNTLSICHWLEITH